MLTGGEAPVSFCGVSIIELQELLQSNQCNTLPRQPSKFDDVVAAIGCKCVSKIADGWHIKRDEGTCVDVSPVVPSIDESISSHERRA